MTSPLRDDAARLAEIRARVEYLKEHEDTDRQWNTTANVVAYEDAPYLLDLLARAVPAPQLTESVLDAARALCRAELSLISTPFDIRQSWDEANKARASAGVALDRAVSEYDAAMKARVAVPAPAAPSPLCSVCSYPESIHIAIAEMLGVPVEQAGHLFTAAAPSQSDADRDLSRHQAGATAPSEPSDGREGSS